MRRRDHGWDHTWCIVFTWLTFLLVIIIYIILRRWKIDQCSGILGSWGWPLARHSDKISDMTAEIKTWMGEGGWGGDTYLGASFTRLLESTTERWCRAKSIHDQLSCIVGLCFLKMISSLAFSDSWEQLDPRWGVIGSGKGEEQGNNIQSSAAQDGTNK